MAWITLNNGEITVDQQGDALVANNKGSKIGRVRFDWVDGVSLIWTFGKCSKIQRSLNGHAIADANHVEAGFGVVVPEGL